MGNILRFPYLCYKNGGGAFLIPYLVCLGIGAFPMFLLEYSLSQFSRRSPLTVWAICPLMKGAGYGIIIVNLLMTLYYNVMNSWIIYYLYNSFSYVLPWSSCDNQWNTEYCCSHPCNTNYSVGNIFNNSILYNETTIDMKLTPSEEFWRFKVLQITDGLDIMGSIRVELLICLFVAWFITFICLCWGIKVSGKVYSIGFLFYLAGCRLNLPSWYFEKFPLFEVYIPFRNSLLIIQIVYFTVSFPYFVLITFMVCGLTLPGAVNGLRFYIFPKWETLLSTKVWGEAALQIFFSSGMGYGGLVTFASYNKFHNNVYRDAVIGPIINSGTSIIAGFVTFTMLGVMAHEKGTTVDQVVSQGPGLAFEAYPAAITSFPFPPVWAFLFFLMLLSVAIDSQFGMIETITCTLTDAYPRLLRKRRILLSALICICQFTLGTPMVFQGGMYILQIIDWYVVSFTVMIVCIIECVVVAYVYGVEQFYKDIELMIGFRPCRWWSLFWRFITPCFLLLVLIFNMAQMTPVSYNAYRYPTWGIVLGWIIALISTVPIPLNMVISIFSERGNLIQRITKRLKPLPEWGPAFSKQNEDLDLNERIKDDVIEAKDNLLLSF